MSSTSIPDGDLTKDEILVEPDDPCNSYEWSILFLLVLIIATILIVVECFSLFKRRGELLSGFDILITFFFVCTIIQFGKYQSIIWSLLFNVPVMIGSSDT